MRKFIEVGVFFFLPVSTLLFFAVLGAEFLIRRFA